MSKVIKMKYQLADLINGQYGEVFTDKALAEQAYADAIAEGKRLNLENSDGESDLGSDGQAVEDFISLVEIPDDSHGTVNHNGITIYLTQDSYCFSYGVYAAAGKDVAGNVYDVRWNTTLAWDDACEAAKNGDITGFAEDDSNACDWDSPYSVELIESAE